MDNKLFNLICSECGHRATEHTEYDHVNTNSNCSRKNCLCKKNRITIRSMNL